MSKIFVVDLEATMRSDNPNTDYLDIVEIGMSVVDCTTLEIEDEFGLLIKPVGTVVGPALVQLTGIKPEDIENKGFSLRTAMGMIPTMFRTLRHPWASWGDFDRRLLISVCERHGYRVPFSVEHLNLKWLYWIFVLGRKGRPKPLSKAVVNEGLEFQGRAHRGVADAHMAALVLLNMMRRCGGVV